MKTRIVDDEITLVAYYPNYATALEWYQDLELCKQVDNRDTAYDIKLLKGMYKYLNNHGDLFYIKYKNRLCGDVCLQANGEVNIVIAKPFQNKHIGRRVINEIIQLAKEKNIPQLHAKIYWFNTQSQKMFQSIGFKKVDDEDYILTL
ncbi:MAG: GNAT family N-acetyltransferase [Oscillospiraceae bacterium]|nr:GNAT family N-acetyltransferase [Oscillospiraceae bacterium]MBR6607161.1 GNAT family N-acetyltransferase [Oscillospiraceae bacterium]